MRVRVETLAAPAAVWPGGVISLGACRSPRDGRPEAMPQYSIDAHKWTGAPSSARIRALHCSSVRRGALPRRRDSGIASTPECPVSTAAAGLG